MTILQILAVLLAGAHTMWLCHPNPRLSRLGALGWACAVMGALVAFTGITWSLL